MTTILDEPRGYYLNTICDQRDEARKERGGVSTDHLIENIVRKESALTNRILADRAELDFLRSENERLRRQNVRYLDFVAAGRRARDRERMRYQKARTQLAAERQLRQGLQAELKRVRPKMDRSEDRNAV